MKRTFLPAVVLMVLLTSSPGASAQVSSVLNVPMPHWIQSGSVSMVLKDLREIAEAKWKGHQGPLVFEYRFDLKKSGIDLDIDVRDTTLRGILDSFCHKVAIKYVEEPNGKIVFLDEDDKSYVPGNSNKTVPPSTISPVPGGNKRYY